MIFLIRVPARFVQHKIHANAESIQYNAEDFVVKVQASAKMMCEVKNLQNFDRWDLSSVE